MLADPSWRPSGQVTQRAASGDAGSLVAGATRLVSAGRILDELLRESGGGGEQRQPLGRWQGGNRGVEPLVTGGQPGSGHAAPVGCGVKFDCGTRGCGSTVNEITLLETVDDPDGRGVAEVDMACQLADREPFLAADHVEGGGVPVTARAVGPSAENQLGQCDEDVRRGLLRRSMHDAY